MIKEQSRSNYITFLQAICSISVVILHTNGVFWIFSEEGYWVSSNFIECLCYFAVPVFFMISGITLIDFPKRYSLKEFFSRRFRKAFVPYLFWSLFGLAYYLSWGDVNPSDINAIYVLNGLLNSSFVKIYWFFPVLFSIYLSMPVFAGVSDDSRKSTFEYLFVGGLILNITMPFLHKNLLTEISFSYSLAVVSEYLIFPVGGVLLYYYPPKKITKLIIMALGIFGFLIHFFGTYSLSLEAGKVVSWYKGYTNLPCVLYSFAVFVGMRDIAERIMKNRIVGRLFSILASYSLPIYLLHNYLLDSARRIFGFDETTLLYRLGIPCIVIPIVVGISWVIRKIPMLKETLP